MAVADPNGTKNGFSPATLKSGQVAENPATRERTIVLEAPAENPERRLVSELHLEPGAAVVLEHLHPAIDETFEVIEGRLGYKLDDATGEAGPGDIVEIPAGHWHDWWHVGDGRTVCRVTVTPGDRFVELIATLWGLGLDGRTDAKGAPNPLQLVAISQEFSDVFIPRKPPRPVQKVVFGLLGPIARSRGYRASYPRYSELYFESTPDDVRAHRPLVPVWGSGAAPPGDKR